MKKFKWRVGGFGYVVTDNKETKKGIRLHRFLMDTENKLDIDHINRNKLDNRKKNLRFVTKRQNSINRKSKGYFWHKKDKRWRICITSLDGKKFNKNVKTEKGIKKLVKKYKKQLQGKFACLD